MEFLGISDVLCSFLGFLLGPWVWMLGCIAIVLGAFALAFEEGKMSKIVGTAILGIGIALAAPKIMDRFVQNGVSQKMCPGITR